MHLAQSKCFFICGELCTYVEVREEGAYILQGVPLQKLTFLGGGETELSYCAQLREELWMQFCF